MSSVHLEPLASRNIILLQRLPSLAGATVIRVDAPPIGLSGETITIDIFGANPEVRTVSSVENCDVTLSSALTYAHDLNATIVRQQFAQHFGYLQEMSLNAATLAGATTATVKSRPTNIAAELGWIVIDPYTSECEVRKISALSSNTFTFSALTYAHAEDDPVLWVTDPTVEVKWFGARGNGSSDDKTAIQRAVTQTIGIAGRLHFPTGTYAVTMTSAEYLVDCTTAIEVYGDGIDRTIIAFGPNAPSFTYNGLRANATSGTVHWHDLTLQGPASQGSAETRALEATGSKDCDLLMERIKTTQNWEFGWQFGDATRTITTRDCDVHGYTGCVNHSTSSSNVNRWHCYNTRFRGIESANSLHHICYLNPGLYLKMKDCRFDTVPVGGGYALHLFGSDNTDPSYCEIINCNFGQAIDGTGAIITNPNGETKIIGCSFKGLAGLAINVANDCMVDDCRFDTITGGAIRVVGFHTKVTNCQFLGNDMTAIDAKAAGTIITVANCVFEDSFVQCDNSFTDARILISNCEFVGDGVVAGIRNYDGFVFANHCDFYGTFGTAAVYNSDSSATTGRCELVDCKFFHSSGDAVNYNGVSNSLFGENNYFDTQNPRISGSVIHNIHPKKGLKPTVTNSAATIALSYNYDQYHVDGTTTINTINLGPSSNYTLCGNGSKVFLIVDAAWALGNSGNILATAGARTIDDVVELMYDASANKWREVK